MDPERLTIFTDAVETLFCQGIDLVASRPLNLTVSATRRWLGLSSRAVAIHPRTSNAECYGSPPFHAQCRPRACLVALRMQPALSVSDG
jgi:hypothetical protein